MASTGIPAEEEVFGVTISRYLSVMGMVVVHYDCLLTLNDEVRLAFLYPMSCCLPYSFYADTSRLAGGPFLAKSLVLL
jgi:hypothetical protein